METHVPRARGIRRSVVVTAAATALVAAAAFGGGLALADGGNNDTYYACANDKDQVSADKIQINTAPKCGGSLHVVSWNANGVPGPQGPQGPAGADGTQGPEGPKGDPGGIGTLDDLVGIRCRVGTDHEGTVSVTYDSLGVATTTCVDQFRTLTVDVLVIDANSRGYAFSTHPSVSYQCEVFTGEEGFNSGSCEYRVRQGEDLILYPGFNSEFPSLTAKWTGCYAVVEDNGCRVLMPLDDLKVTVQFGTI